MKDFIGRVRDIGDAVLLCRVARNLAIVQVGELGRKGSDLLYVINLLGLHFFWWIGLIKVVLAFARMTVRPPIKEGRSITGATKSARLVRLNWLGYYSYPSMSSMSTS